MLLLLLVYLFWLFYLVTRAAGDSKMMPHLGVRIKFFGIFTLLVVVVIVIGVIFGAVGFHNNGKFKIQWKNKLIGYTLL